MRTLAAPLSGMAKQPATRLPVLIRQHAGLLVILGLYLLLGLLYSIVDPIFESSDEYWHYPVVAHIAQTGQLPVQPPRPGQLWRQEGSQAPLYYMLGAALTFWVDSSDLPTIRWENPNARNGGASDPYGRNLIVHTPAERFPYHGTVLAVHLIRAFSVLLGGLVVIATYGIARALIPQWRSVALAAAAWTAFNPMFLFISASVNNDTLVNALSALSLWLLVLLVQRGNLPWRTAWLLGGLLGAASLAKLSGLTLAPPVVVALLLIGWQTRDWRHIVGWGALVGGVAALLAGWWYWRNWQLYGDPTGLNVFIRIDGLRHTPFTLQTVFAEWEGFEWSYWGIFGGFNLLAPGFVYIIFGLAARLGVLGLCWLAVQRGLRWLRGTTLTKGWGLALPRAHFAPSSQENGAGVRIAAILLVAILSTGIGELRWTAITPASQGRLIFAVLAPISVLLALGGAALLPRRVLSWYPAALATIFAAIALYLPLVTIAPAYAPPPVYASASVAPAPQHPLHLIFRDTAVGVSNEIELLGYDLHPVSVAPGGAFSFTLYWRAAHPITRPYELFYNLYGFDYAGLGFGATYPGRGLYPPTLWKPGTIVRDSLTLAVPQTPAPLLLHIQVGLTDGPSSRRLAIRGPDGQPLGDSLELAPLRVASLVPPVVSSPPLQPLTFANQISLVGYRITPPPRSGQPVTITLYWRAETPIAKNYTIFLHLLDANGARTLAQQDSQPRHNNYPTSSWQPGELIEDAHQLQLAPGSYQLDLGLYQLETLQRLPLTAPASHAGQSEVVVTRVEVK